jgi:hypothetical protein
MGEQKEEPIINIVFVDGHSGDEVAKASFYTVDVARRFIYLVLNDPESICGIGEIRIELSPEVYIQLTEAKRVNGSGN